SILPLLRPHVRRPFRGAAGAAPVRREKQPPLEGHSSSRAMDRGSGFHDGVGLDVDARSRQLRGQTGVLPLLADRERELVVGHEGPHRLEALVDDERARHLRGAQRVRDERRQVVRPVDDVDLLVVEFARDGAHPGTQLADAGALGVDAGLGGAHRDLRAVARLARERCDLDDARGDLGHLEGEELAHEARVGAAHRDRGALEPLRDARDVHPDARPVRVVLARHLLLGRQDRLDRSEVDVHHPGVGPLLDDARDDVALLVAELAEHLVVADVAQPLVDDLLGREGRDAAEVFGAVDRLADDLAVLVALGHVDGHVAGLAVELGAGARGRVLARVLEVGRQDGLLDDLNEFVEGDLALSLHEPQHGEVDVHVSLRYSDLVRRHIARRDRPLYPSRLRPTAGRPTRRERWEAAARTRPQTGVMPDARAEFADVYRRHLPAVSAYLARRVPREDVEDLASDVFAIAWRKRATVTPGEELPWLYRI